MSSERIYQLIINSKLPDRAIGEPRLGKIKHALVCYGDLVDREGRFPRSFTTAELAEITHSSTSTVRRVNAWLIERDYLDVSQDRWQLMLAKFKAGTK